MRIIRNAFVYSAPLPGAQELIQKLSAHQLQPLAAASSSTMGFVHAGGSTELVAQLAGCYAFAVQIDKKDLPSAAVNKKLAEKIEQIEQSQGRKVYRKERLTIKDDVIAAMLPVAFVTSRRVNLFYLAAHRILIVETSSENLAFECLALLREALGSLKALSLQIDGLTESLTNRLLSYARGGTLDLGQLSVGGYLQLTGPDGQKFTFQADSYDSFSAESIEQAIAVGCKVKTISLIGPACEFKLTSGCAFKAVRIEDSDTDQDIEDAAQLWMHNAYVESRILFDQITHLLALTGSLFPPEEEA